MHLKIRHFLYRILFSALIAGCSSHGNVKKLDTLQDNAGIPEQINWQAGSRENLQTFANDDWLLALNDPRLIDYVNQALNNNHNLLANAANLQASIYAAKINNRSLYPSLDFSLNYNKTQNENFSSDISYTSLYSSNIGIAWEPDIWGKLSNQKKSAVLSAEASAANYKAAQLSLVGNIAKSWFTINSNKLRLDLSRQRLQSQLDTLSVVEEQYKGGLLSARDVYLSRTDVENQKSAILDSEQTLEVSIRTFKRLLGQYPGIDMDFDASLPTLTTPAPSGLPSELLARRPDIIASRIQWESAIVNAKAKQKARFPSFSLTANYGASSNTLSQLDEQNLLWNLVSNLSLPLFRGGALKAQADQATSQANAALYNYVDTLLVGFTEVENTLSNEQRLQARLTATIQSAFYAKSGYELALEQYQSGIINYSAMLDSQRRWFDAESAVILLRNSVLQNRIDLNLALGGDFTFTTSTLTQLNK